MAATLASVGVPETTPVAVLIESPPGNDGLMTNTLVPLIPVAVYAVVAVMALPTTPLTDCAVGVIWAFAEATPLPSCTTKSDASNVLTRKIRFMFLL